MASLTIRALRKDIGGLEILKGIDLAVEDREFLVLVGPSGCGKSTLLNLIAGHDTVSAGEIRIGDRVVNDVHPKDRDIAMVFQSYALYPTMNVRNNITFGLRMRGVPKAEQEVALARAARTLQIEHLLDRKPAQLSGGQRQRVAMGRALVRDPKVFLFDEPLSNLDALLRVDMRTEIKRLHQRLGTTIVYVTHDQIEAMTLATRIAVMKDGEVLQLADPQTVYESPANMFVAGFIGSPSTKFAKATIVKTGGALVARIDGVANPAGYIDMPVVESEALKPFVGHEVFVGIRPESLTDPQRFDEDEHNATFLFDCQVEVVEPTGADVLTFISLAGSDIVARVRPGKAVHAGQSMQFMLDLAKVNLFDPASGLRLQSAAPKGKQRAAET
jgi:multiple sugar transport system ATP-binding protein